MCNLPLDLTRSRLVAPLTGLWGSSFVWVVGGHYILVVCIRIKFGGSSFVGVADGLPGCISVASLGGFPNDRKSISISIAVH